ncbi:hypothetical protein ACO0K9_12260 [Undibacterium sp. Ji50W]|uniref:hypothetical protein n=1 Tax=Undibacterium sp. Ji50W TaxID=3413041 RepID=UPI003BF213D8
MKMPVVRQDYYPLGGGLDLVTPSIAMAPGMVIDAQNYEPAIGGGYRRIDGYERFDGRPSPSAAAYTLVYVNTTAGIAVGNTVTGASSTATALVLAVFSNYLVCSRVSATFQVAESLRVGATPVATVTAPQASNGASSVSDHVDYALLAANDQRSLIQVVPGSGPVRGVWVFNDVLYAFRDNVAGTAAAMYKATGSGWVQVSFGVEVQFTAATAEIKTGDAVSQGGVSGVCVAAMLRTGTWTSAGAGTLVFAALAGGAFAAGALQVSGSSKVTASGASTAITRLPGGRMEFFNYNFTGASNASKMYGADGVNLAFEFDGNNYVPLRTGMTQDTPAHVIAHKGYLFLSFNASVQYSSLGAPYSWTVVTGAGELDCSKPVTGFLPQGGNQAGSSLAIFTAERTFVLYGTSNADFKLVSSIFDIGYSAFTCQQVSNDAFGMTTRGIQALTTTLNYGDFDYASISHMIQPLVTRKRGLECASTTLRTRNQYRVYFTDGTALAVGLTGDKVNGMLPLNYNRPVRCICTANLSNGTEVTYFGSDDGYVYQDNAGTSQDGNAIEAWCRLPFNNNKSPRIRKRFRRAVFEVVVDGFAKVNISYDLGYGNPAVLPSAPQSDTALSGGGGYWDQFNWDQFNWDAAYVSSPSLSIDGTEKNIGLLFYSNRSQDQSHTLQGVTLMSTPQLLQRS